VCAQRTTLLNANQHRVGWQRCQHVVDVRTVLLVQTYRQSLVADGSMTWVALGTFPKQNAARGFDVGRAVVGGGSTLQQK
jgi:hypothetical protein